MNQRCLTIYPYHVGKFETTVASMIMPIAQMHNQHESLKSWFFETLHCGTVVDLHSLALLGQSFCVAWSCLLLPSNGSVSTSLSLPMATVLEFEELYLGDSYTSGTLKTFAGHLCVTPYMPFRHL